MLRPHPPTRNLLLPQGTLLSTARRSSLPPTSLFALLARQPRAVFLSPYSSDNSSDYTLPPSQDRLVHLAHSHAWEKKEVTVYIKGFLSSAERPDHFDKWLECHKKLHLKYGWGNRAYGYQWQSGSLLSAYDLPIPTATVINAAWYVLNNIRQLRFIPSLHTVALVSVQELAIMAGQLYFQYREAMKNCEEHAHVLAAKLQHLKQKYQRVRVVAHSLGCKLLVEAVKFLKEHHRPNEIHLCAPALYEEKVKDILLSSIATEHTFLYYNADDAILRTAFRLLEQGPALGAAGPSHIYPNLSAIDVRPHFGVWVHSEYRTLFDRFAQSAHHLKPAVSKT
ncbi:Alpha/beta hydrolase [Balamuthia mandrillaris]